MKTLLISTVAAALVLTAGSAFASQTTRDDGYDVFLMSQHKARTFLMSSGKADTDQGVSLNGKWDREFRRVQGE